MQKTCKKRAHAFEKCGWLKYLSLSGMFQKNDLPLHPLRMQHTVRSDAKKGSEKILKNSFKKIWWFENKHLSLHRFPLKNRGQNSGRGRKADPGEIKEIVLIVIYWTAFFEVFEQLKVFSTLAREWFQTIPLRLELKIYNKTFFYNGEFDPGSGWTLAAGLTHASRGAAEEVACYFCRRPAHGCVTRMQPTFNRGIIRRNLV